MNQKKITALNGSAQTQPKTDLNDIVDKDFVNIVPVVPGQIGGRSTNTVSEENLHIALGVASNFSTLIELRIDEYGFVIGHDYAIFDSSDDRNQSSNFERIDGGWKTKPGLDHFRKAVPEIAAQLRQQIRTRISAANLYKPMCAALKAARAEQGKETLGYHYSSESNMIAKMVLGGLTAKQWAQINGVKGEPRDSMNIGQLEHLAYLESTNITLIEMGMDYHKRKAELIRLSQRWLAKHVGDVA